MHNAKTELKQKLGKIYHDNLHAAKQDLKYQEVQQRTKELREQQALIAEHFEVDESSVEETEEKSDDDDWGKVSWPKPVEPADFSNAKFTNKKYFTSG